MSNAEQSTTSAIQLEQDHAMNRFNILTLAVTGIVAAATTSTTDAQHFSHHGLANYGNHHNHVFRDRHGHVIGRYHRDIIQASDTSVVPHTGGIHHGSYYARSGRHFYYPQTAAFGPQTGLARPQEITFGAFSHVDDLAVRLEALANELCLDLYYNYSHNFEFRETYSEAYQVLEVARYIHDAEHRHDRAAIQEQLGGLDDLFHHVQDDVRGWTRHHRRQIGNLGILSKMDLLESTLHHLMNDVGVRLTPATTEQAPPPADQEPEQAPQPLSLPTGYQS
jgi:hypothetical protein